MALNDRRIIFSTYVVPSKTDGMDEESITHTTFQTSPNGTLGGKGIADINNTQWGDGWTSFAHMNLSWENWNTHNWEGNQDIWDGIQSITTATGLSTETGKVGFLYIKNTGDTNDVELALQGADYNILIPPGGAVSLRPNIAYVDIGEVKVQSGSGTTIEYIIAKSV